MGLASSTDRPLSLSAGTLLDAAPTEALAAAADAGFAAFGIRWDPERTPLRTLPTLRARIDAAGLRLLDLEVIRLQPGIAVTAHRAWIDAAAELGAQFLLTVSTHQDPARTADELAQLAHWCPAGGPSVALEFMPFTSVPTFRAAAEIIRAVGTDRVVVLVDALHLHRGGESPADLRGPGRELVGYVQLCDAEPAGPPAEAGLAALAYEARHDRRFPGEGGLPLTELLGALPGDLPCGVEVQSDGWRCVDPAERARHAMATTRAVLARANRPTMHRPEETGCPRYW